MKKTVTIAGVEYELVQCRVAECRYPAVPMNKHGLWMLNRHLDEKHGVNAISLMTSLAAEFEELAKKSLVASESAEAADSEEMTAWDRAAFRGGCAAFMTARDMVREKMPTPLSWDGETDH